MGIVRDFRDLVVWQRAMQLAEASHALASSFPLAERPDLAINSAARQCRFLPTSPRGMDGDTVAITFATWESLEGR